MTRMHIRRLLTIVATTAAVLVLPALATAATLPAAATHTAPAADYKGWAFAKSVTGATTIPSWKWAAAGWQTTTFDTGSYMYLYPWGAGWNWAWVNNAWYAVKTENTATYSCGAVPAGQADVYPKVLRTQVAVLKAPSVGATQVGIAKLDDRVQLTCSNGFKDHRGGTTQYVLAKVTDYAYCAAFTWECVLNPAVKSTVGGYIDVTSLSEHPVLPPNNGGLGVFPA